MKDLKKDHEPVTYDGAGHGFMRAWDVSERAAPVPKGNAEADNWPTGPREIRKGFVRIVRCLKGRAYDIHPGRCDQVER